MKESPPVSTAAAATAPAAVAAATLEVGSSDMVVRAAESVRLHLSSRSKRVLADVPAPAVPPFDDLARKCALQHAVAVGKKRTQSAGLRAIHAVLHRGCFASANAAYSHFDVPKQSYFAWLELLSSTNSSQQALPSVSPDALR